MDSRLLVETLYTRKTRKKTAGEKKRGPQKLGVDRGQISFQSFGIVGKKFGLSRARFWPKQLSKERVGFRFNCGLISDLNGLTFHFPGAFDLRNGFPWHF